jgi:N6-adenosine-specific RNA methylase IME4
MNVSDIATDNAHLYLWTTNSFLRAAFEVMDAWGFQFKTNVTWVKLTNTAELVETPYGIAPRLRPGMGRYFRGVTEHCLFGVRGRLPLLQGDMRTTAFFAPRGRHSTKPEAFYSLVESSSPGPYLELFARRRREGWTSWGNEV